MALLERMQRSNRLPVVGFSADFDNRGTDGFCEAEVKIG
jgi:hypothetical protein